jgi:hypothetical protein
MAGLADRREILTVSSLLIERARERLLRIAGEFEDPAVRSTYP